MYIPDVRDVVWLEFDPQTGREQKGHRPAVVLSPKKYNSKTGLMVCCPMTTKIKGYPFEVVLEASLKDSAVLSDQVKSLDWQNRKARYKGKITDSELQQIKGKLQALLQLSIF